MGVKVSKNEILKNAFIIFAFTDVNIKPKL